MTNRRPFDLEAAKRGEPVVTRRGHAARIVSFDHKGHYPIVAFLLSEDGQQETISQYFENGKWSQCFGEESNFDLFMAEPAVPEPSIELIDRLAEVLSSSHVGLNMISVNEAKKGQIKSLLTKFHASCKEARG